jgi:outer membrane protein assembly factor BamB
MPVWESNVGARATWMHHRTDGWREAETLSGGRNDFGGCPIAAGGVVAVSDHNEFKDGPRGYGAGNGLVGFDAKTGQRLWYVPGLGGKGMLASTPLAWRHGGKTYFIGAGNSGIGCVESRTGKVVWRIEDGGFQNAAAVSGDDLVCELRTDDFRGMACYRLAPSGVTRRWTYKEGLSMSSPAVYRGHLYTLAKRQGLLCIDMQTGRKVAQTEHDVVVGSLAVGDGRIFVQADNRAKQGLSMLRADPNNLQRLGGIAPVPFANSTSPALADGRLYFRGRDRLLCYDVTAR